MAYMHRNTFEIYMEVQDEKTPNEWFFVDDMIAPSIQLLNRKGYATEWCCAGHSVTTYFGMHLQSDGEYKHEEYHFNRQLYVAFAEGVTALPPLPDGFYTTTFGDMLAIRYDYPAEITDAYDFMAKVLEINKRFYDWVLLLPDYKEYRKNKLP